MEQNCNFDNHHSIFGNSGGLSHSLSHVDLTDKLECSRETNPRNNCSKQVKRATSYMDVSILGKEKFQGNITGPYIVNILVVHISHY